MSQSARDSCIVISDDEDVCEKHPITPRTAKRLAASYKAMIDGFNRRKEFFSPRKRGRNNQVIVIDDGDSFLKDRRKVPDVVDLTLRGRTCNNTGAWRNIFNSPSKAVPVEARASVYHSPSRLKQKRMTSPITGKYSVIVIDDASTAESEQDPLTMAIVANATSDDEVSIVNDTENGVCRLSEMATLESAAPRQDQMSTPNAKVAKNCTVTVRTSHVVKAIMKSSVVASELKQTSEGVSPRAKHRRLMTEMENNLLQCFSDEPCQDNYVHWVRTFVGELRAPSPACVAFLFNKVIFPVDATEKKVAFDTLLEMENAGAIGWQSMPRSWRKIMFTIDGLLNCSFDDGINIDVLDFCVKLLESDVNTCRQCLRDSIIWNIFNPEFYKLARLTDIWKAIKGVILDVSVVIGFQILQLFQRLLSVFQLVLEREKMGTLDLCNAVYIDVCVHLNANMQLQMLFMASIDKKLQLHVLTGFMDTLLKCSNRWSRKKVSLEKICQFYFDMNPLETSLGASDVDPMLPVGQFCKLLSLLVRSYLDHCKSRVDTPQGRTKLGVCSETTAICSKIAGPVEFPCGDDVRTLSGWGDHVSKLRSHVQSLVGCRLSLQIAISLELISRECEAVLAEYLKGV